MQIAHRIALYVVVSYIAYFLFVLDYVVTYEELYPTIVALSFSSSFKLLLLNFTACNLVTFWFILQFIFFGRLHASERTMVLSTMPVYLGESLIASFFFDLPLIGPAMLFNVMALIWRLFHVLGYERVTTLSTTRVSLLSALRMSSFLTVAIFVDVAAVLAIARRIGTSHRRDTTLLYSCLLIYGQLLFSAVGIGCRYAYTLLFGDRQSSFVFIVGSIMEMLQSVAFVVMYAFICTTSSLPILLLRNFIGHLSSISTGFVQLQRFLRLSRRIRRDMPDATAEDLASESRCTICYEDMSPGSGTKRLPCSHCYHTSCLGRWLESHSTCPYCRADIMTMTRKKARSSPAGSNAAPAPAASPNGGAQTTEATHVATPAAAPSGEGDDRTPPTQPEIHDADVLLAYMQYIGELASQEDLATQPPEVAIDPQSPDAEAAAAVPPAVAATTSAAPTVAKGELSSTASSIPASSTPAVVPDTPSISVFGSSVTLSPPLAQPRTFTSMITSMRQVERRKILAYQQFHQRLAEAEAELQEALRAAAELEDYPTF